MGDFNTPLTPMDRSTKKKINKETQTLNDTIDQLDLIAIYRTFHPKTVNFTFISSGFPNVLTKCITKDHKDLVFLFLYRHFFLGTLSKFFMSV